jgi:hypothetical protein
MPRFLYGFILLIITGLSSVYAQSGARISGKVSDDMGRPVDAANVAIPGGAGTATDVNGRFSITLKQGGTYDLIVTHINHERYTTKVVVADNESKELRIIIKAQAMQMSQVEIESDRHAGTGTISIDPENARTIATPGDPVMNLIKSGGLGVASNNELSSGYSVRGGNFDENLIYINDIEIYRPFLARSGQQEGLSFINSDLVESIAFSSGGFESRYGDKMSSVLDIKYKRPTKFKASASAGLLGFTAHIQDAVFGNRLRYTIGGRYRSNNYLFRFMDTKGEYKPQFYDLQSNITFDVSEKVELAFLGIYSDNQYNFIPKDRETAFGTVNEAYKFKVFFEGKELTRFRTGIAGLTLTYRPVESTSLKLITSYTNTRETETFDVLGQYFLSELDNNLGSETFGEATNAIGVGSFLNHARNRLEAHIFSVQHRGSHVQKFVTLRWGVQYQREIINDRVKEWNLVDSSGYFVPFYGPTDTFSLILPYNLVSRINLESNRFMGFYENAFNFLTRDSSRITLNFGGRAQYWTVNGQFLLSPRLNFSVKPNWKKNFTFRIAGGLYYQAPFYRELRDRFGQINTNVKAQRSIHAIVGMDYIFQMWKRPFKFTAEAYYKYLDNLNPYQLDNIRIRYYANNLARGYAAGLDMKLHGEFIKGIESWATLSVMGTQEDIKGDFYYNRYDKNGKLIPAGSQLPVADSSIVYPGFIPRPTDQRVSFSIFFQDHIRNNPNFKVHLNLVFGTGWPFGPPTYQRYRDVFRMPFYRRVDIGFSFRLLSPDRKIKKQNFFRHFRQIWTTVEAFNLLGINNTVSYQWIRDNYGVQHAIPNYLTPRLINARIIFDF